MIDPVLATVSNGGVTTDMVSSNDAAFPGVFPYLARPNVVIPEPSSIALAAVLLAVGYRACRYRNRV